MGLIGTALGLGLLLVGDQRMQAAAEFGIDPLEVLDVQIKNNVMIIFDTSGSMKWPTDTDNFSVGGDDPASRFYQAKAAVDQVVRANRSVMNFGIATYNALASDKELNNDESFDNDGRDDGPVVYVSGDVAAGLFYLNYRCPRDGDIRPGYWCQLDDDFADHDGTGSADVYRSFGNGRGDVNASADGNAFPRSPGPGQVAGTVGWNQPYPVGCTPGTDCRYYLQSKRLRHGRKYVWNMDPNDGNNGNKLISDGPITCPNPPAGLTGFNPDSDGNGVADEARPCVQMEGVVSAAQATTLGIPAGTYTATYYYSSAIFDTGSGSNCGGAAVLATVAPCNGDNADLVLDAVRAEIEVGNYTGANFGLGTPEAMDLTGGPSITPEVGIRSAQGTPLGGALNGIRTATPPVFELDPTGGLQKNFVILLTDGDETCNGDPVTAAFDLYTEGDAQRQAEVFVIAFTTAVDMAAANEIARAGSGGTVSGTCPGTDPTAPCRDALLATNTDELIDALTSALEIAVSSGTFAASPGVIGSVFELAVPPADPLDPDTRYDERANLLFQSSFSLPNWEGTVEAFRNDGTAGQVPVAVNTTGLWDAGQTLYDNVSQVMAATTGAGGVLNEFAFDELHGGASVDDIGTGAALIKRRIFTSAGGGRFPRSSDTQFDSAAATGRNVVALWPPNQAGLDSGITDVDPIVGTAGPLDDALGIGAGSTPVLTFAQLRSFYGACEASADAGYGAAPAACATSDIATARKESRQILLAWLAGAQLALGGDGLARRDVASALLYEDRDWIMGDSTFSKPAVMSPPLRTTPNTHTREWVLFRDGRRDANREGINELDLGFGLRNPDIDDVGATSDLNLKPRMSVLFAGTNVVLHALSGATSEELWAYLPFDLLGNVSPLMRGGQTRDNHVYGISTSIRLADIFVAEPFTVTGFTFAGRWRTFIYFGRGAGGKHLTALDVTAPGPYTRPALEANPPWVAFSRGNPDVDLNGNEVNVPDTIPYSLMGQTWSVPAVGNVQFLDVSPADGVIDTPPEWRIWVGSGYSSNPDEGSMFYSLDAVTGDVVTAHNLGDPDPTLISNNALVASPAAWNSYQLDPPLALSRSPQTDYVSRVYIPDLHGRVWKFDTASGDEFFNASFEHPIADGPALMKLSAGDFVFVGSGHDVRVPEPSAGFKVWGLEDSAGDADISTDATVAFDDFYPTGYRNRSEPATVFSADGFGRVFFLGQRFNEPGVTCLSTFDAFVFALGAATGAYVYDFDSDGTGDAGFEMIGTAPMDIDTSGNRLNVMEGGSDFTPTPVTTPTPSPPEDASVVTVAQSVGSPVCRE
jgi:hypothetical protein